MTVRLEEILSTFAIIWNIYDNQKILQAVTYILLITECLLFISIIIDIIHCLEINNYRMYAMWKKDALTKARILSSKRD